MAVAQAEQELLESAYRHFNVRDIDGVLRLMAADVNWPNGMDDCREIGHEAVRAYWRKQWLVVDPHVKPVAMAVAPDGRVVVEVHQVVRDLEGVELMNGMLRHIYRIENGLIERMDVEGMDVDPAD